MSMIHDLKDYDDSLLHMIRRISRCCGVSEGFIYYEEHFVSFKRAGSMLRQGDAKSLVSNFGIDFYLVYWGVKGGGRVVYC